MKNINSLIQQTQQTPSSINKGIHTQTHWSKNAERQRENFESSKKKITYQVQGNSQND